MNSVHLNQEIVNRVIPDGIPFAIYDSELKGLCIVVEPSGTKSWIVWLRLARDRRPIRRLSLGNTTDLSADEAREIAGWLLGPSVKSIGFDSGAADALKNLHRQVAGASGEAIADRVVNVLSRLFAAVPQSALSRRLGVGRRFLTPVELAQLGSALEVMERSSTYFEYGSIGGDIPKDDGRIWHVFHAAAVKLMLLTLVSQEDLVRLAWDNIDLDLGLIALPGRPAGTKSILLSSAAAAVLRAIPRLGRYVIVGADPDKPRYNLVRAWAHVQRRARIPHTSLHALRRTHFWIGSRLGVSLDQSIAAAEGRTGFHDLNLPQARATIEAIGNVVTSALKPSEYGPLEDNIRRIRNSLPREKSPK